MQTGDILASLDTSQLVADVRAAQASLQSAEANRQKADSELKRIEKLVDSNSASQAEFDDANAAMLSAEGLVDARKSALRAAESQLLFTDIRVPSPGVVIARQAEVGQVVGPAQTVFTVAGDGEREAVFDVFPTHIPERPIDDEIGLTLLSDTSVKTTGVIREIAPSIDVTTGAVHRLVRHQRADPNDVIVRGPVVGSECNDYSCAAAMQVS